MSVENSGGSRGVLVDDSVGCWGKSERRFLCVGSRGCEIDLSDSLFEF